MKINEKGVRETITEEMEKSFLWKDKIEKIVAKFIKEKEKSKCKREHHYYLFIYIN